MAGQTESVWAGRPPLTWFLDHLGQVKKITQRHYTTLCFTQLLTVTRLMEVMFSVSDQTVMKGQKTLVDLTMM